MRKTSTIGKLDRPPIDSGVYAIGGIGARGARTASDLLTTRWILAWADPMMVVAVFAPAFAVAAIAVGPVGEIAAAVEAVERVLGRTASRRAQHAQ